MIDGLGSKCKLKFGAFVEFRPSNEKLQWFETEIFVRTPASIGYSRNRHGLVNAKQENVQNRQKEFFLEKHLHNDESKNLKDSLEKFSIFKGTL